MATFVTTTLTKRSGTSTVFSPGTIESGVGTLYDNSATSQAFGARLVLSAKRQGSGRRVSRIRVTVPQVDKTNPDVPRLVREGFAELTVSVPDGMAAADVNDLVGYIQAAATASLANLNDILVNGTGVY